MDNGEPIEFYATVEKVQTMQRDGAIRVYLDLPETALLEMARLVECKIRGVVVDFVAMPRPEKNRGKHKKTHV